MATTWLREWTETYKGCFKTTNEKLKQLYLDSFFFFGYALLGNSDAENGGFDLDFHFSLCQYIQNIFDNRGSGFYAIGCPRDSYKTRIGSHALPTYLLARNSQERILMSASTDPRAEENLSVVREYIQNNEKLGILFPDIGKGISNKKNSARHFNLNVRDARRREYSIDTRGITSTITGTHPTVIICDDIFEEMNTKNSKDIKKVETKFRDMIANVLSKGGTLILIYTRWDVFDLVSSIKDDPFYRNKYEFKFFEKPIVDFQPPFPKYKHTSADLQHMFETDPIMYAKQYALQPQAESEDAYNIRRIWYWGDEKYDDDDGMEVMCDYEKVPQGSLCYAFLDPATGLAEDRGKKTGIHIAYYTPDCKILSRDAYTVDLPPDDLIQHLYEVRNQYKIQEFIIEKNRFELMQTIIKQFDIINDIKETLNINWVKVETKGDKVARYKNYTHPLYKHCVLMHHVDMQGGEMDVLLKIYPKVPENRWDLLDATALMGIYWEIPFNSADRNKERVKAFDPKERLKDALAQMRAEAEGADTKHDNSRINPNRIFNTGVQRSPFLGDYSYFK
jgi:hypothetical protein